MFIRLVSALENLFRTELAENRHEKLTKTCHF